jgi:hypothetical protein
MKKNISLSFNIFLVFLSYNHPLYLGLKSLVPGEYLVRGLVCLNSNMRVHELSFLFHEFKSLSDPLEACCYCECIVLGVVVPVCLC